MSAGNYLHQLDAKNRMRIPAKFREELGEGYYITVGTGNCLYVYSKEQMAEVQETLHKVSPYRDSELKGARYVLFYSWQAEEDNQGRILIPENLRRIANITKNVVVYKGPACIEIWSEERWNEYLKDINFNSLADALDSIKNA
ncbi:MAG: cell division/cell wall cluster transcriptional repressor MraZ [Clostridia bacterium]|nr:cell division/cell wall cluster transcriptional repressor MraZ [Clostridia bacterium]